MDRQIKTKFFILFSHEYYMQIEKHYIATMYNNVEYLNLFT